MKLTLAIFLFISCSAFGQTTATSGDDCHCQKQPLQTEYNKMDHIIEGEITQIDTLSIGDLILDSLYQNIANHTDSSALAMKALLDRKSIIVASMDVKQTIKGSPETAIKVCTPVSHHHCGYEAFHVGESFVVFLVAGSDISPGLIVDEKISLNSIFSLKDDHTYWTNKCLSTAPSDKDIMDALLKIKIGL